MKGILFKPEMIVATVERWKTNTRRAEAGLKEISLEPDNWILGGWDNGYKAFVFYKKPAGSEKRIIKPRYHIGETVYIKEAWRLEMHRDCYKIGYKDGAMREIGYSHQGEYYRLKDKSWQWINPLFMPEWAARYFTTITDVRAERLQEIVEEDAEAEGVSWSPCGGGENPEIISAVENFADLWNSINAKWKAVYNKKLKIYEYWQFPWAEEDAKPIPKTTPHPERYHCIPNPWVFAYAFEYKGGKP